MEKVREFNLSVTMTTSRALNVTVTASNLAHAEEQVYAQLEEGILSERADAEHITCGEWEITDIQEMNE